MVQKLKVPKTDREKTTKQASLLMINYYFPPVKAVGAVRIGNFYKHALDYFQNIQVLTTSNQEIFQQESESPEFESVNFIPTFDFRRLLSFFQKNVTYFSSQKKKHPLKKLIIRLIDSFPLNILIGDGGLIYILMGYLKARKLIKEQGITHIFSSFRPYSDHIIAYLLKLEFAHLFWIADFRDVQVDPNRKNILFPSFQHWCNKKILKKADLITSVSKGYTQYLSRYNPNTYCLNNGIGHLQTSKSEQNPFSKFTISYTGSIYPELQNPNILFKALKELIDEEKIPEHEVQFILAGRDQEVWKHWLQQYGLGKILNDQGSVPRSQALKIQVKSHINLLLSWSSSQLKGVLTGKLYEYLNAGHPILCIINGLEDPEFEELFEEFQAGMITYNKDSELQILKDFLHSNFTYWKTNNIIPQFENYQGLERLQWAKLMEHLMYECQISKAKENTPVSLENPV